MPLSYAHIKKTKSMEKIIHDHCWTSKTEKKSVTTYEQKEDKLPVLVFGTEQVDL